MEKLKLGVVGCGAISDAYFGMAKNFPVVEVVACADLRQEAAEAKAQKWDVKRVLSVDELIADDEVEAVLNLTIPSAHVPIALQCLEHGKHTYAEKPLGVDRENGRILLERAKQTDLKIGCAPDTFLGAGIQTARKAIDDGLIGKPVTFTAFMMGRGHEHWHPSPEFYYKPGGGPMFDMGPYYLTALLNLLGPIRRVTGFASIAIPERTITSKALFGTKITVETPDHYTGSMEFANGCVGTIVQSFATRGAQYDQKHPITVFGTTGSLKVPDPNHFDGTVELLRFEEEDKGYQELPHTFVKGYGRSIGMADMAYAIRSGRPHRCSIEQAFVVLDAMQGFRDASDTGHAYTISAEYTRPAPMPAELPFGQLDA